jgi:uncharacterized integral membrane protein (TIGR00697 family)
MNNSRDDSSGPNGRFKYFDIIMALFVAVLLISNIASSAKIIDWGISLGSIPLAFDAGTMIFPISYIFGDILTEVYGYKRSRKVIWVGFAASVLMSVTFGAIAALPGDAYWKAQVGDTAYNSVLGGVSSGGIVVASLVAYLVGEFSNSFVLAKLKIRSQGKHLWIRTISSTLIGEGMDTTIFIVVATIFGVFPWELISTLIITNYIFKVGIEVLMTPITYAVVRGLKRVELEDYYDYQTDFNPFRIIEA